MLNLCKVKYTQTILCKVKMYLALHKLSCVKFVIGKILEVI
jgi:hypothetical protein